MKLLFEIGTEELPPDNVVSSVDFMASEFARLASAERLGLGAIETFATPRRLAIRVADVADSTTQLEETRMGPAVSIAFDADGAPTKAALGFAKGQGIEPRQLVRIISEKGEYVGARIVHPGRPAADVLPAMLDALIRGITWPRPMRWGWTTESWGRPVHWLLALLDSQVVPVTFAGVKSDKVTWGHRFLGNRAVKVPTPNAYEAILKQLYVVPSSPRRREDIWRMATEAAGPDKVLRDDGLLDEVTQLVEWPVVAVGRFDPKYLVLPRELLISEMREHQRYFAVEDAEGHLQNRFVVVYNTPVKDPELVVRGNQRVLVARLSDGVFFMNRDLQRPLSSRVDDLERVTFLQRLGSMRDKVDRVVGLSAYLAGKLFPEAARHARRAALLSKADLTTGIVGEFPELQGAMGRVCARHDNEPPEVCEAIYEHYLPRSAHDKVAQSQAGIAVAMADKMDTIASCFALGLVPSGAADPYGLRRAALGIIRTVLEHSLIFSLGGLINMAVSVVASKSKESPEALAKSIDGFFRRRIKAMLGEHVRGDIVDSVVELGIDDIEATAEKVWALATLRESPDFEPLAAAVKRVGNILKEQPEGVVQPEYFQQDAEARLFAAYGDAKGQVDQHLRSRDYQAAATALIGLKGSIDRFFESVLVNAEDPLLRKNRLGLLRDVKALFETIADISRIQASQ